ncbi:MBOAT family protein [Rhodovarius crocodyli]|uniref:Probable alginate O-acetylase AlgI n=1 Tax=Rhodovarius crocodyli TaxID=1979269 RepID=A0A437MES0_9PROT|nr:MBOAT family O-acyltransferase [Rhodovarius crocodyli]RVT96109.1 MBOAT family protein [Rhodovarius crocodyli]
MLFPTGVFAIFFLVVFTLHWGLNRWPLADRLWLLAASAGFYAFWDARLCLLLGGVGLWAWGLGHLTARDRRWLWLGISGVLAVLGLFKYADFFLGEIAGRFALLFGAQPPDLLGLVLPVGISFYCFQAISYMVDVSRGELRPERGPLNVVLYLGFFPHLAAGPIVRAAHFLPQLREPPDAARLPTIMACLLILGGLVKKLWLANTLAVELVDPAFRDPTALSSGRALLAIYGYAAQIWCDFSAYSDMAIGVAALLGYHFPRNFDQPYRAASLREFWRRWHISLSFWFRDYVYKPLGGDRGGRWFIARNAMIAMTLSGLWHGAAWNFLLWGMLHGAALVIERMLKLEGRFGRIGGTLITFHIVCLGWVLFRATDMSVAGGMLAALGQGGTGEAATLWLAAITAVALALHFLPADWPQRLEAALKPMPAWALGLGFGLALVIILTLGPAGVAPFIYFQF